MAIYSNDSQVEDEHKDATDVTAGDLPDPPDPPDPPGPAALLDALRGSTRALVQCS